MAAHQAVGGSSRGRRRGTRELNHAAVLLLSAEFQGFCRDVHDEVVSHIASVTPPGVRPLVRNALRSVRRLDRANPDESTLAVDFRLLGFELWDECASRSARTAGHRERLRTLMAWRNAIAHSDFTKPALGGRTRINLSEIRRIRSSLNRLVDLIDGVAYDEIRRQTGTSPW